MTTTRAQFLRHVHPPLHNSNADPPHSSPTKSTYRLHWRELREWETFTLDTQTYWDALDDMDKNAPLPIHPAYWSVVQSLLHQISPSRFSREHQLATPFANLYAAPHNEAISGAGDEHARLDTSAPDDVVGQPDGCFENNEQLTGIVEIKSFWNLTEQAIDQVLQGTTTPYTCIYNAAHSL